MVMLVCLCGDFDLMFVDSLVDSIGVMMNYFVVVGYECEIWVNYLFWVGQNWVGDWFGCNGILYVYLVGLCCKVCVGKVCVGDCLVVCQLEVDDLYCLFKWIVLLCFEIEFVLDID